MKVKETFTDRSGGMGVPVTLERVIELDDKAEVPVGAVKVPSETEVHDWKEAK